MTTIRALLLASVITPGCTTEDPPEPPPDPVAWATEPGPHPVGYTESEVVWSEPGVQDTPRTLRLAAWYPTSATSGATVRYQGLFDAPGVIGGVDPIAGPLPLAVFSHGHAAYAEAASFLAVHLASHGWLVLAPDHTGNTTFDFGSRTTEIYWQRPMDISATIDLAQSGEIASIDDTIVVIGHSFGAYTTHALSGAGYAIEALAEGCTDGSDTSEFCSTFDAGDEALFAAGLSDPRIVAHVSLAPGDHRLFGDEGVAQTQVPTLLMTGGLDPGHDGAPFFEALIGPDHRWFFLPDAGHNGFTDFAETLDPVGAMPAADSQRITRGYGLAFAEVHGRGQEALRPLLDGDRSISGEASLHLPQGQRR